MSAPSPVENFRLLSFNGTKTLAVAYCESGLKAALEDKFGPHGGAEVLWGNTGRGHASYLQRFVEAGRTTYKVYAGSQYGDRLTLVEEPSTVTLAFGAAVPCRGSGAPVASPAQEQECAYSLLQDTLAAQLKPVSIRPSRIELSELRFEN